MTSGGWRQAAEREPWWPQRRQCPAADKRRRASKKDLAHRKRLIEQQPQGE